MKIILNTEEYILEERDGKTILHADLGNGYYFAIFPEQKDEEADEEHSLIPGGIIIGWNQPEDEIPVPTPNERVFIDDKFVDYQIDSFGGLHIDWRKNG